MQRNKVESDASHRISSKFSKWFCINPDSLRLGLECLKSDVDGGCVMIYRRRSPQKKEFLSRQQQRDSPAPNRTTNWLNEKAINHKVSHRTRVNRIAKCARKCARASPARQGCLFLLLPLRFVINFGVKLKWKMKTKKDLKNRLPSRIQFRDIFSRAQKKEKWNENLHNFSACSCWTKVSSERAFNQKIALRQQFRVAWKFAEV